MALAGCGGDRHPKRVNVGQASRLSGRTVTGCQWNRRDAGLTLLFFACRIWRPPLTQSVKHGGDNANATKATGTNQLIAVSLTIPQFVFPSALWNSSPELSRQSIAVMTTATKAPTRIPLRPARPSLIHVDRFIRIQER